MRLSNNTTRIALVYHSGYGHTKVQADAVARGAADMQGTEATLIPAEEAQARAEELNAASANIFGALTYMGSVSAQFKNFMDGTSKIWAVQSWRNKLVAGFTNLVSQSGRKLNGLIKLAIFAVQQVNLGLIPDNNTSKGSPEDLRVGSNLAAAEHLSRRMAARRPTGEITITAISA